MIKMINSSYLGIIIVVVIVLLGRLQRLINRGRCSGDEMVLRLGDGAKTGSRLMSFLVSRNGTSKLSDGGGPNDQ